MIFGRWIMLWRSSGEADAAFVEAGTGNEAAFVDAVESELEKQRTKMLFLHNMQGGPPTSVLIDGEHFQTLMNMVPKSEAMTEWIMNHGHIEAER